MTTSKFTNGDVTIGRRRLLAAAGGLVAAGLVPARGWAAGPLRFPDGFGWGVSTSAYQIEGAVAEDGRQPSIWDVFCHTKGRVWNGDTGDVACDHYHRFTEDVALMGEAGLGSYRFSLAWPRIVPDGTGPANPRGLDFYDRLVDALLARGIEPWACLYHWDLPEALQRKGGWLNRDIASWFADYGQAAAGRLGDRVRHWAMLNEPSVVAIFGHGLGSHAPGLTGRASCLAALHHQNLAQGRGLAVLRAAGGARWRLGTVLSLQPVRPAGGLAANQHAAALWDALWNRACLDPLFLGRYPELLAAEFAPLLHPDDFQTMRQPIDFLGVNYYSRMYQQADPAGLIGTAFGAAPAGTAYTDYGWPIEPDGLVEQLADLRQNYGNPPVIITENGADFVDHPGADGRTDDARRIDFLRAHLTACRRALDLGCNLQGYMAWTLLDNFEWAEGYRRHFGLVAVDRATLKRTPKQSYYWYAAVARSGTVT